MTELTDPRSEFDTSGVVRDDAGRLVFADYPQSVVELLAERASHRADHPAVADLPVEGAAAAPQAHTYAELWETAGRVAGGLRAAGIGRGDRVAIRLPAGVGWVTALYGVLLAGAVAVPVNTRFTEAEVARQLADCDPALVLDGQLPDGPHVADRGLVPDDLAMIFYTSGTTGEPRGACLTNRNVVGSVMNLGRGIRAATDEPESLRGLVSAPLFHVTGCLSQVLTAAALGATAVIAPRFSVDLVLGAFAEQGITWITGVPTMLRRIADDPAFGPELGARLRVVQWGGAPTPPDLVARIATAFPNAYVANGYGSTECSGAATLLPHRYAATRADSVGLPLPVAEVEVLEPDAAGVGEIVVRGMGVMSGYWRRPELNATVLEGGWLRTGDLGRVVDGFVHIVDRKKDMINRGGEKVFCVEVEGVLAAVPGIEELAVVGVPDPDLGERIGLVVRSQPGVELTPAALIAHARSQLAVYKIPEYVVVTDAELPRNAGGKVLKPVIRDTTVWAEYRVAHAPSRS